MGNGTALREESEARKVQRFRWARWNAPLVLLLLSFTIMLMLFLSKRLESTSGNGSLAPYVFAALLCTLVASSITLIGCSSKQTERFNQSVISQANSAASKLVQTAQAHSRANEQNITKISHLVDNQQQLLDKFVELKSAVENRHEFLHKTTQGLKEELTESIAAVYSSNKTIQSRIDGLLLAGKLMSGRIGATLEKQELLCSALREHSGVLEGRMSDLAEEHQEIRRRLEVLQELIQAISGDITDVAREQASLHDKVDIRGEESVRRIEMLSEDHASLSNDLGQLGENVKQGSVETIEAVTQQMVNHESFKAHAEALNVQFSGLADAQEQLRGKVNGLREFITAVDSNVADLVHKQAKLHETVENRAEESVLHLETLSRDHKNVQNQLEKLDETVRNVSAEAVELVTRQLMSRESFEAHREALYNQLSGLVAAQEQFRGHVNDLRELLGAVAGDVTNIAREQGTLHETIGKQSEENTGQMEELVQKSLQHIEALSDDHRNLHTHLNHLGEEVKQASVEAAETVVRRVASRESFEAHTKALDAQLSGFSAAQEQLRNHIDGLRELIQGVVGDVTNVAHEQAIMHKAIEIKSEESVRHMEKLSEDIGRSIGTLAEESANRLEGLSQDHMHVHNHLDQLCENVKQAGTEAVELVTQRVSGPEYLHANANTLDTQLSGLFTAQEQLRSHVSGLRELLQAVARDITNMAREQASLHEAFEAGGRESARRLETLSEDHRKVRNNVDQLGETVKNVSADAVKLVVERVASRESVEAHAKLLDSQLSGLTGTHEQLRSHVVGLRDLIQAVAGDVTDVALKQVNLHETVTGKSHESIRHLETLSEGHASIHNHLDRLGENIKKASAETVEYVTQRTPSRESFQTHVEELDGRLSGLGAAQEQVRNHIECLRNLMEAISSEQANLHETVETRGEESFRCLETLSKDHASIQNNLDHLGNDLKQVSADTIEQVTQRVASRESLQAHADALDAQLSEISVAQEQLSSHVVGLRELMQTVAGEQATLQETIETRGQESVRRFDTLSAGHKATHVQLDHLGENVRQISAEAAEMIAQRVASRESFQAHAETLDAQLSGLAAAQEQLHSHVDGLKELLQAVVDEQASLHEAVETRGEESVRRLKTLWEDHRNVRNHLDQLGETIKHVSAEAVDLVARRVSGDETFEAHAEALNTRLSGLANAQKELRGNVDGLRDVMQTVAGEVTNVVSEQANLQKAFNSSSADSIRRFDSLSQDHTNLHNHLNHLGEDVKKANAESIQSQMADLLSAQERLESNIGTTKEKIEMIAAGQNSLDETQKDSTSGITTTIAKIEQLQQTLKDEISNLGEASQRTIASIEAMTTEQTFLRQTVEGKNDDLARQIAAFSEGQRSTLSVFRQDLEQTAKSMASVARDQDHIENTVTGTSEESLSKLDAITDDQKNLSHTLAANEAQINEMAEKIGDMQQQVAGVLEMLNTCIRSLTDVLDSNDKQQSKLEETINQNLTAVADLISKIQENRTHI